MSRSSLLLLPGLCTSKALGLPPLPPAPYFPQLAAAILKSLSIRAEQGPSSWQLEEGTVRCFETQSERLCACVTASWRTAKLYYWPNASLPHLRSPLTILDVTRWHRRPHCCSHRPTSKARPGHPAAASLYPGDWTTTSDRTSSKVVDFGRLVDDVKQTGKPDWRCCLATDEARDVGRSSRCLAMNLSKPKSPTSQDGTLQEHTCPPAAASSNSQNRLEWL